MAKFMPDAIIDLMLDVLAAATQLTINSTQPTTYAEANATYMLAAHVLAGGDFSKGNGDGGAGGRKLILAAQNGFSVTNGGTALHYALTITGSSTLLLVGTVTSQVLSAGNTINFPATDVDEIGDYV